MAVSPAYAASGGMTYVRRTVGFWTWAVRPDIAPAGTPEGVTSSSMRLVIRRIFPPKASK